jgi:hypothetical protein
VLFPSTITLTDPSRASGIGFHNSIKRLKITAAVSKYLMNEDLRLTRVRLKVLACCMGLACHWIFRQAGIYERTLIS